MKLSELRRITKDLPKSGNSEDAVAIHSLFQKMGLTPGSFYQELEMDSPYVDTHQDISYSNRNFHFHSHTFYEMLCCRNTCNAEYLVGTERYKLQKGDIILVPPGISHRPLLPEHMTAPYIRDVLWFSEEFLAMVALTTPEILSDQFQQPFLFRTGGTGWEHICELFRYGVQEADLGELGWNTLVTANASNILIQLARAGLDYNTKPVQAEKPELMDEVLAYIEARLSEKITLADTAHHFYISESTISQTFRKKMNVSFYKYVTQRRLIASKSLIENGIPLESVSEQIGFTDYSSFFRAFKQEYGISPRQYRKMLNM